MEQKQSGANDITSEQDLSAKRLAAANLLKKIGDETDTRNFSHLISEWKEDCGSNTTETNISNSNEEEESIYYRLYRQASEYIRSWTVWGSNYSTDFTRTDSYLSSSI